MKAIKCTNEIHARIGDVIFERDGKLVTMPASTYEAVRRDLGLPTIAEQKPPRRRKKRHAMTPRLERVRDIVRETSNGSGEFISANRIAALSNSSINHVTQILYTLHEIGAVTRERMRHNGREVYGYRATAQ